MRTLTKTYFKLTAWYPRKMPRTQYELIALRETLTQAFGLENSPENWYTILSQLTSTKPTSVRKSYRALVNVAIRLGINKLAQDEKMIAGEIFKARLEETAKRLADELRKESTPGTEPLLHVTNPEPDGSTLSDRTHRIN